MTIDIRRMCIDDLKVVNSIRNHESTRFFLRNTSFISYEETLAWFNRVQPKWLTIVREDKIVGYIRTSHDTEETLCIGCDVHPDERRKGIATQAYKKAIDYFYKSGYLLLWLEVFENNIAAIQLYEKLGFKTTNKIKSGDRAARVMTHAND